MLGVVQQVAGHLVCAVMAEAAERALQEEGAAGQRGGTGYRGEQEAQPARSQAAEVGGASACRDSTKECLSS